MSGRTLVAHVGDRLVLEDTHAGERKRVGVVVELRKPDGSTASTSSTCRTGVLRRQRRRTARGGDFAAAIQALYRVTYAAHFLLKSERGQAPRVGPLEAL